MRRPEEAPVGVGVHVLRLLQRARRLRLPCRDPQYRDDHRPAAYAATFNGIGTRSRAAIAAGDREAYAAVRREFWDAWLTTSPHAASHRVGDASYREAYINFMTAANVVTDLDPATRGPRSR